jgi:hypothetical protein
MVLEAQENNMENFKEYTKEKWEDFGLLAELPEDRKEMVVSCYNIVMDWLAKDDSHEEEIEALILPLLYRIAKIVDLTKTQVIEICKEFQQSWSTKDSDEAESHYLAIDFEMMFISKFAEMKINQYKK